jgi:hypothetical protein
MPSQISKAPLSHQHQPVKKLKNLCTWLVDGANDALATFDQAPENAKF